MADVVFPHENLIVWQRARDAFDLVAALDLSSRPFLADQLLRAVNSVKANIAEGAGEFAPKEKARFYRMALRSATESGSHLDTCASLGHDASSLRPIRSLLEEVFRMLTTMLVNLEDRV